MTDHRCRPANILIMYLFGREPLRPSDSMKQMSSLEEPGGNQQVQGIVQLDIGRGRDGDAEERAVDNADLDGDQTVLVDCEGRLYIVSAGVVQMDRQQCHRSNYERAIIS